MATPNPQSQPLTNAHRWNAQSDELIKHVESLLQKRRRKQMHLVPRG